MSDSERGAGRQGLGRLAEKASSATKRASEAAKPSRGQATPRRGVDERARPRTRTAHLRLTAVDPWSVMKMAFLLSIALGIVCVVAVTIIWTVLGVAGVFDSLNSMVAQAGVNNFNLQDYIGAPRVIGFTLLVSIVNVVLLTAIATLAAFLYNLTAALVGGLEVTLAEDR